MVNRYAAGFTIASFPFTASLFALEAGTYLLAACLGCLFLLGSLLTLAPRIPGLRRLPVVGAVRLEVRFRANGSPSKQQGEIVLEIADSSHDLPQTILVEVEVRNLSRGDAEHVLFNMGTKTGCGMRHCDGWGDTQEKGERIPPISGFDRVAFPDLRFCGGNAAVLHLRLRARKPGTYPVFALINSGNLYRPIWRELAVRVVEHRDPGLRDRLSPIIEKAEAVARKGEDALLGDAQMRVAITELDGEAIDLLREVGDQDALDQYSNAEANYIGATSGEGYIRAMATAKARALIEIRDRLGRVEEAEVQR